MTQFNYTTFLQIIRDLRLGKLVRGIDVQYLKAGCSTLIARKYLGLYHNTVYNRTCLQHCIAEWYIPADGHIDDVLNDGLEYHGIEYIHFGEAFKQDYRLTLPYLYQYFRNVFPINPSRFAELAPLTTADFERDPMLAQFAAIGRGDTIELPYVGATSLVEDVLRCDNPYDTLDNLILHERPNDKTVTIDDVK